MQVPLGPSLTERNPAKAPLEMLRTIENPWLAEGRVIWVGIKSFFLIFLFQVIEMFLCGSTLVVFRLHAIRVNA